MVSVNQRLRRAAGPLLVVALFGAALVVLHRELGAIHYRDVATELRGLGSGRVAWGVLLTALSYAALTAYDALGLRHAGRTLGALKLGVTSFIAYGFSHSLAVLGGGTIRYRLYSAWGLTAVEIATIVAMNGVTLTLGFLALVGAVLATEAPVLAGPLHLGVGTCRAIGGGALATLAVYFAWIGTIGGTVRFRDWALRPPSLALSATQLRVCCCSKATVVSRLTASRCRILARTRRSRSPRRRRCASRSMRVTHDRGSQRTKGFEAWPPRDQATNLARRCSMW